LTYGCGQSDSLRVYCLIWSKEKEVVWLAIALPTGVIFLILCANVG
jgi:hypothetical protein